MWTTFVTEYTRFIGSKTMNSFLSFACPKNIQTEITTRFCRRIIISIWVDSACNILDAKLLQNSDVTSPKMR